MKEVPSEENLPFLHKKEQTPLSKARYRLCSCLRKQRLHFIGLYSQS